LEHLSIEVDAPDLQPVTGSWPCQRPEVAPSSPQLTIVPRDARRLTFIRRPVTGPPANSCQQLVSDTQQAKFRYFIRVQA